MNRQIRLVGIGVMALFVALFVQLNYLQVVHAGAIDDNPLNGRTITQEFDHARGQIVSADGQPLATSTATPGGAFSYERHYPMGPLFADVTGYLSFTYGADGVEREYNSVLTGGSQSSSLPTSISGLRSLLTDKDGTDDVVVSISTAVQQAAATALGGRVGSVVAVEPATGAVLALYSNPTYDPGLLALPSQPQVMADYKRLVATPGNPLSPGSYRNAFPPGSTFKIITAAAALDRDPALVTKPYPVLSALPLPQTSTLLHNFGGEACGGQLLALFTVSCDTGFGAVGLDLGAGRLAGEASSFGFDQVPPLDLPAVAPSTFPPLSAFAQDQPAVAYSAIGQQDVTATPLQIALVAAGIADGGTVMAPHVLDHVTDSQGRTTATYDPKAWLQATSPATAATITGYMLSVVQSRGGTGGAVAIPGVHLAAKTGTAQTGTRQAPRTDDWFAVFGPVPDPTIAVAVVLPGEPTADQYQGGTVAAPVAKAVIEAWLASPEGKAARAATSPAGVTGTAPAPAPAAAGG